MLKHKILIFCLSFFSLYKVNAVELDWRTVPIPSISYNRIASNGGGAIYTLQSQDSLKFRVQVVFSESIFALPESDITAMSALSDMIILGGFGKKDYAQIEKELTQNGIFLTSSINSMGQLTITCEALTEDFVRVMRILNNLILRPKFDEKALKIWKQQAKNSFSQFTNANTLGVQMQFISAEAAKLAFGKDHYLATTIKRHSPRNIDAIKLQQIKNLYDTIKNRNGLNLFLVGSYPKNAINNVNQLITRIPSKDIAINKWLPGRLTKYSSKTKVALIRKKDMTQSQISLRYYYPYMGELNSIEKAQIKIASEVFSSTVGVIGNDRFSKAMRADSGLSYSPRAFFIPDVIDPNTNVSAFMMNFQSPNDKVYDAVILAQKTWQQFTEKGISKEELSMSRSSVMNSLLGNELTVYDKSNFIFSKILQGKVPSVNPIQESLESLELQKNASSINQFIKDKLDFRSSGVLIIMGNPSKDVIKKLRSISSLDFIEVTDINSLI